MRGAGAPMWCAPATLAGAPGARYTPRRSASGAVTRPPESE
jgi:hypothetical protein